MTRRKFIRLAGASLAFAAVPTSASKDVAPSPATFGGVTPNASFYVTSWASIPRIDLRKWTLKINGLVERPLSLNYNDIMNRPSVTQTLTMECISNPPNGNAISNAQWTGVKLKPLLEQVGIKHKAEYAAIRAADGYYTGIPVDEMIRDENWMPYRMNGVPLPEAHGYPLRLFIPGKYGMKQPKWITEIEFVDRKFVGYFEERGWSNEAWRKVSSGFFYPRPTIGLRVPTRMRSWHLALTFLDDLGLSGSATVKAPVTFIGWALAGPSGIRRVQVSVDDGETWADARTEANPSTYIWTVWRYRFAPRRPSEYIVRVKATDGDGESQPENDPQKGSGMSGQPRMRLEIISTS